MIPPEHFSILHTHAEFVPEAEVTLHAAADLVSAAIVFAREHDIRRLLADTTRLTGFRSPGVVDRIQLAERFAAAARSKVKLALVAKAEFIDPDHFGISIARSLGLFGNIFSDVEGARRWLLDPHAK